jgi:restriction system protein
MPIPDFQSCMLPILRALSDRREYSRLNIVDKVADNFKLPQEERETLLPSGSATIIVSRVGWARTYLLKAGLLIRTRRGHYSISEKGIELANSNPETVNIKTLMKYEEFRDWQQAKPVSRSGPSPLATEGSESPDEEIEKKAALINKLLVDELLDKVQKMRPAFFERLVLELLIKMGYGGALNEPGTLTAGTGDEGIDGIIKEDKLGLDVIYLQAKKWDVNAVGRPEIQKFAGALLGKNAAKGVFITTSTFSRDAVEYAKTLGVKIVLIDGKKLAELMIEHDLGVTVHRTIELKKIDLDYFSEDE